MMRHSHFRNVKRDELQPGDVVHYPFLFPWQRDGGVSVAEKLRPCVVMLRFGPKEEPYLALVPLTTRPIRDWEQRVLIPQDARASAGLNPGRAQSIVVDSCNIERIHPADDRDAKTNLPAIVQVGTLGPVLLDEVCRRFKNLQMRSKVHVVKREAPAAAPAPEPEAFTPIPGY